MATYHLVGLGEVHKIKEFILPAYHSLLQNPAMLVYCAKEDELVVGAIGVWLSQDVANIVSLAVSPAYQRQGIGQALVDCVQERFEDFECESLQVTLSRDLGNFEALDDLFYYADFKEQKLVPVHRVCKVTDLLQYPAMKKALAQPRQHIIPMEQVPRVALQMYGNNHGAEVDWNGLDPKLSMVAMNNGQVAGVLGVQQTGAHAIEVVWLHVPAGQGISLVYLMVATASKSALDLGKDCSFSAALATPAGKKLLAKLLPKEDTGSTSFARMAWMPQ